MEEDLGFKPVSLETGRLWKKIGCCYAENPSCCLSLSSHTLSLHPSLSLYLPSLPAESEFSDKPRLNFLAALGGCQSRPGSPAHKPPQQLGQWLSHKPSAPSLPFCQANDFCRQLASDFTGSWLSVFPLSTATSAQPHRKWLYPCSQGRISLSEICQMAKSKLSELNTNTVIYTKLTELQTEIHWMIRMMHTNRFSRILMV